jgi:hypothetical protein
MRIEVTNETNLLGPAIAENLTSTSKMPMR